MLFFKKNSSIEKYTAQTKKENCFDAIQSFMFRSDMLFQLFFMLVSLILFVPIFVISVFPSEIKSIAFLEKGRITLYEKYTLSMDEYLCLLGVIMAIYMGYITYAFHKKWIIKKFFTKK